MVMIIVLPLRSQGFQVDEMWFKRGQLGVYDYGYDYCYTALTSVKDFMVG